MLKERAQWQPSSKMSVGSFDLIVYTEDIEKIETLVKTVLIIEFRPDKAAEDEKPRGATDSDLLAQQTQIHGGKLYILLLVTSQTLPRFTLPASYISQPIERLNLLMNSNAINILLQLFCRFQ